MFVGPVFHRELATAPRRPKLFAYRAAYAAGFLVLMSTAWSILTGAQVIRSVGDMSRFGLILFDIVAPLQMAIVTFYAAISAASAVAQEKDKQTMLLLLMTRLNNSELVVGKLLASLLQVLVLIVASLPIFMLIVLFGGVSFQQVASVFLVTATSAFLAAALGVTVAFWRDKTFQSLAIVVLILALWLGFWEVVHSGVLGAQWAGFATEEIATAVQPLRAVRAAARPASTGVESGWLAAINYIAVSMALAVALIGVAIWRVRVWNPSRQLRRTVPAAEAAELPAGEGAAEVARKGHVDARVREMDYASRTVWDNPVLWREVCTWAYGRKVLVVRVIYAMAAVAVLAGVHAMTQQTMSSAAGSSAAGIIPPAAQWLVPFFFVSLVIVNAMAVTSITTERDGRSIDLLLATDLSPREFVFGKLFGVLSVAGLMVVAPAMLSIYLWFRDGLSFENLLYVLGGLVAMNVFVTTLGIHCGTRYANSRSAIGVSLGTVFFLFLGVVACIMMMISFSGSFQVQMAPFLAFILGGGVGLYVSLGAGNPSKAIAVASMLVPFLTFHCITSFLLRHNLSVFLVSTFAYGFATAAMLIPSLNEFNFATRHSVAAEE